MDRSTELRFEVVVHLDFDDGQWRHNVVTRGQHEDATVTRDDTIKLNIHNIGETIESSIYDEYGRQTVTVSARFLGEGQ